MPKLRIKTQWRSKLRVKIKNPRTYSWTAPETVAEYYNVTMETREVEEDSGIRA